MSTRCPTCDAPRADAGPSCLACLMNLGLEGAVLTEAAEEAGAGSLDAEAKLGTAIGPYTLERILGEGGMGVVYLALQSEPIRRRVAIKLVRTGMDSREVLARFDAERQTLALLDHPNIARVIDAGATPECTPYFVMEHVDGVPVTDYCDQRRLDVGQRIELFIAACEAIQHAHFKGIIHRDIKPSNVLVTEVDGTPVPKVIDFGLAKATRQRLAGHSAVTRFGRLIGTPEYMSPEQASLAHGEIDTRTDLYSLGILLYELLVGAPPLDPGSLGRTGLEGLLRQIRDAPSPRPSLRISSLGEAGADIAHKRRTDRAGLMRRLAGELDWVVMKAIDKDRDRRYATVQQLVAELRRYLSHEPVEAGPPGALYRLGKLVRRHRVGTAAAAAIALALVLGIAGTSLGWVRAARAERRALAAEVAAREEAEAARQVSDFLTDLFRASTPGDVPPETITALDILDRGAERVRHELAGQPLIQARMMLTIATVYQNLDLYEPARELAEQALRIRRLELASDHVDLSHALHRLALILVDLGRYDDADRAIADGLAIQDRTVPAGDPRRRPLLFSRFVLLMARGRFAEAEPVIRRVLELAEAEHGPHAPELAEAQGDLASVLIRLDRLDEAEGLLVRALDGLRRLHGEGHVASARTASRLALLYQRQNRLDEAIGLYRQIADIQERNLGPTSYELSASLDSLAVCHAMRGEYDLAAPLFRRGVAIIEELFGPDHVAVGRALTNVGNIERDLGNYDRAESVYRRALGILERDLGDVEDVALALGNLAGLLLRQGELGEALSLHQRALGIRERVFGPHHRRTAMSVDNVASTLRERGRLDEAEPLFLRGLAIREKTLAPDHPLIGKSLHGLGTLYGEQGRDVEAAETLERAIDVRRRSLGPDHPHLARSLAALAVLHRNRGRSDEADALFRQAVGIMEATYDRDHPEMREMLSGWAALMRRTGRATEARALEARALALDRR